MTSFLRATIRAIYLLCSAYKLCLARWALLDLLMSLPLMHFANRAASTSFGSTRNFSAALCAMFGIAAGCAYFSSMNYLVAWNANRHSVVDFKRQVGVLGNWFNMMSMEIAARLATFLTSIVVSHEYFFAPLGETASILGTAPKRHAAFPVSRPLAGAHRCCAPARAKCRALVPTIEFFSTKGAKPWFGRVTRRPTLLGAVAGGLGSVSSNAKWDSAFLADVYNLSVFHILYYTAWVVSLQISPGYVAVALQRYVDTFGVQPELID